MPKGPLLGRAAGRHGSCCGGPPGIDCADYYKGKKAQRADENRQWRREEEMTSGHKKIGRPRRKEAERFPFRPEELEVRITSRGHLDATAVITHLPTGLVIEGHDPDSPGSVLGAKRFALRALQKKLEELDVQQKPEEPTTPQN